MFVVSLSVLARLKWASDAQRVDVYSFSIVLYELLVRHFPYADERAAFKKAGGKGMNSKLFVEISKGKVRAELPKEVKSRLAESPAFAKAITIFNKCRKFNPYLRPIMPEVVKALQEIEGELRREAGATGGGGRFSSV